MMAESIEMHLELMQQSGDAIPPASTAYEFAVDNNSGEELCTWVEVDETRFAVSP